MSESANAITVAPTGTAFTDFLYNLNGGPYGCTSDYGYTHQDGGFAGHCDWRLPTIAELQTILLAPYPCGTSPRIDPIFWPPPVRRLLVGHHPTPTIRKMRGAWPSKPAAWEASVSPTTTTYVPSAAAPDRRFTEGIVMKAEPPSLRPLVAFTSGSRPPNGSGPGEGSFRPIFGSLDNSPANGD